MDGVPLEAWFIPADSDRLVIANHPQWANHRYGLPGHLELWKQIGAAGGNDFEINFMPDYKNLHAAGYNVLAYDMRNFGHSGAANGGIASNGIFESRDVVGSLRYVKARDDLRHMAVGLLSRCLGANATIIAMTKYPEWFTEVRCLVSLQPVSLRPFFERITEILGIEDRFDDLDREIELITSFRIDDMSLVEHARNVRVPTFIAQAHDDVLAKPTDVQSIYDNIPVEEKRLFWIEGTTRRWDGYNYFPQHPDQMLEWFDKHMA